DAVELWRQVLEFARRQERPASGIVKRFTLVKTKLAPLQLSRFLSDFFFSPFSVFDIDARSEPLNYRPVFVTKRYLAMKKCPVFPVRAPNACFGFKRFATCQSSVPFLNYSSYIVGMNRVGPLPATDVL